MRLMQSIATIGPGPKRLEYDVHVDIKFDIGELTPEIRRAAEHEMKCAITRILDVAMKEKR